MKNCLIVGVKMNNLETYKKIYNLDTLKSDYINDNTISFVLLDNSDNYYILRDDKLITYSVEIPLNIINLIKNIEKIYRVKIYNYFPICFVKKNSLVFACKVKEVSSCFKIYDKNNKELNKIIDICERKSLFYSECYNDEILLVEKYKKRYKFYNKYIKGKILTERKRRKSEFLTLIKKLIGNNKSIIDVTCGDNDDIFKISDDDNLVVGNDINLYQLKCSEAKYNNVIFTNDNILDFSFNKNIFDVSYCKNTLHHMNDNDEIIQLFNNMYNISNKIIIVEIVDPKATGGLSKFLNTFLYVKYLKDSGKNYLTFPKFKKLIDDNFNNCDINYLNFENILGKYMIAVIEKR